MFRKYIVRIQDMTKNTSSMIKAIYIYTRKIDKQDLIEIKIFGSSKQPRLKKEATDWENIFVNHISD